MKIVNLRTELINDLVADGLMEFEAVAVVDAFLKDKSIEDLRAMASNACLREDEEEFGEYGFDGDWWKN